MLFRQVASAGLLDPVFKLTGTAAVPPVQVKPKSCDQYIVTTPKVAASAAVCATTEYMTRSLSDEVFSI